MAAKIGHSTTADEVVEAFASRVRGRTFVITGTSAKGLGAQAARSLARGAPAHLVLVARARERVEPVIAAIAAASPRTRTTFVEADLTDLASVRGAAERIVADDSVGPIDVLLNNAGVMYIPAYAVDGRGCEVTLSANHVGHFLLTNLLMPKILAAASAAGGGEEGKQPGSTRVVNVTSEGHRLGPFRFDDWNFTAGGAAGAGYDGWTAYGQAKTANVLFAAELGRRLAARGVRSYAAHPGLVLETGLIDHLGPEAQIDWSELPRVSARNGGGVSGIGDDPPKTLPQGAASFLVAALDPALDEPAPGTVYIRDCNVGRAMDYATDRDNAARLWTLSEELVGQKFDL